MRTPTRRPRNAAASREALLESARLLFSERGYDNTTVRDIGESAGVDAALIARYFGNKLNLYLATVVAEDDESARPDMADTLTYLNWLAARIDRRGPGPVLQALVRSNSAPEIREAARAYIERRLIGPLAELFVARAVPTPRLRAETLVAGLIGVLIVRSLGNFEQLSAVTPAELTELLAEVMPDLS